MNALLTALARATVEGGAAIFIAWIICRTAPKLPSTLRCWIWRIAYLKLVIALFWLPSVHLPILRAKPDQAKIVSRGWLPGTSMPHIDSHSSIKGSASPAESHKAVREGLSAGGSKTPSDGLSGLAVVAGPIPRLMLALAWMIGVAVGIVRLVLAYLRTVRIRCLGRPASPELVDACRRVAGEMGIRRVPALRLVDDAVSPMLVGVRNPDILLPTRLAGRPADADEIDAILAHELAHLKRRDLAWRQIPVAACIVFFFHPLVWLAAREWDLADEMAADELAIRVSGATASGYGALLLRLAVRGFAGLPTAAAAAGSGSGFSRRLSALQYAGVFSRRRIAAVSTILVVAGVLLIVPWQFVTRAADGAGLSAVPALTLPDNVDTWLYPSSFPDGKVFGTVVAPNGDPVQAAVVSWVRSGTDGVTQSYARATTGRSGRFIFANADDLLKHDPLRMVPWLVAQAPGYGLGLHFMQSAKDHPAIVLASSTELDVKLIDPTGKPVAGVPVHVGWLEGSSYGYFWLTPELNKRYSAVSDRSGIVRISGLPGATDVHLMLDDSRFAKMDRSDPAVTEPAGITNKRIVLLPAASISGRVLVGGSVKPVAGIRVVAQAVTHSPSGFSGGDAVTDSEGVYTIGSLRPGRYTVWADAQTRFSGELTATRTPSLTVRTGRRTAAPTIRAITGAVLTGRVTGDHGLAAARAEVQVLGPSNGASAFTDAAGRYRVRVPGGRQHISVVGAPLGFAIPPHAAADLFVADGATGGVDFRIQGFAPQPIHGQVVGPDGAAAPGATVVLDSSEMFPDDTITAGDNGRFNLNKRQSVGIVHLRAFQGDLGTPRDAVAYSGDNVVLKLVPNVVSRIEGVVDDERGRPVAGADVSVDVEVTGLIPLKFRLYGQTSTGPDGTYAFDGLPIGAKLFVAAHKVGYTVGRPGSRVTIENGRQLIISSSPFQVVGPRRKTPIDPIVLSRLP